MAKLLAYIIEDNVQYAELISYVLKSGNTYETRIFNDFESCIPALKTKPDLIILDYQIISYGQLLDCTGLFEEIKRMYPGLPVFILSSQQNITRAVQIMKKGVFDYVLKDDTSLQRIEQLAGNVATIHELTAENNRLKKEKRHNKLKMAVVLLIIASLIAASLL